MLLGLTACGKPNVEKTFDNLLEQNLEGIVMDVNTRAEITYTEDDVNYKAIYFDNISVNAADTDIEPKITFERTGNSNMFGLSQQEYADKSYYDASVDELYQENLDGWLVSSQGATISGETISEGRFMFLNEWFLSKAQEGTDIIGANECYIFKLHMSGSQFMELMRQEAELFGIESRLKLFEDSIRQRFNCEPDEVYACCPVDMTGYVAVTTGRLIGVRLDFSELALARLVEIAGLSDSMVDNISINKLEVFVKVNQIGIIDTVVPEGIENATAGILEENTVSCADFIFNLIGGLDDMDFSQAVGEEIQSEEELEFELYASSEKEVMLYSQDARELLTVYVPEGYAYYPKASDHDMINLMSDDMSVDCVISSDPLKGWTDTELVNYLNQGEGPYHSMLELELDNPLGQAYMVSADNLGYVNKYIVIKSGQDFVIISFNPEFVESISDQELADIVQDMLNK